MASVIHGFGLVFIALSAWITAIVRRLLLGPRLPSWSWTTELSVASARAVIAAAVRRPGDGTLTRFGMRFTAPVPGRLRSRMTVRRVRIAGMEADRYLPEPVADPHLTVIYFHGGGYVFGNPGTHRTLIAQLSDAAQVNVVAPRYRLAPEHRYPAAVDDAEHAYRALLDAGHDPRSIVLAGDSAGGGLAAALVVRISAVGLPAPGGLLLFSPYLDLTHASYTIRTNADTDYLPLSTMKAPNDSYAEPHQLADPEVSPLNADLAGFPPMLVFAGGAEMLLGDSLRFAERATESDADLTLIVEDEMMHVWPAFADWEPASKRAMDAAARWLDERRRTLKTAS